MRSEAPDPRGVLPYETLEVNETGTDETAGVAYMAHIGGFVAGIVLVKLFTGRGRAAYR